MTYYYSTTKISLGNLSIEEENGWHVKPLHEPASIDMHSVHAYEPGCVIPKIELQLEWNGAGEPEKKKIEVEGGNMESFTLFCGGQPPVTPAPTSHSQLHRSHNQPAIHCYDRLHQKHNLLPCLISPHFHYCSTYQYHQVMPLTLFRESQEIVTS